VERGGGETERWSKVGGIACLDWIGWMAKEKPIIWEKYTFSYFCFFFGSVGVDTKTSCYFNFIYYINKIFENILIPTAKQKKREKPI
jgi:hypothetical protein